MPEKEPNVSRKRVDGTQCCYSRHPDFTEFFVTDEVFSGDGVRLKHDIAFHDIMMLAELLEQQMQNAFEAGELAGMAKARFMISNLLGTAALTEAVESLQEELSSIRKGS